MEFGSGSTLLGGAADPLQEAMARRQTGQAGATQQVSPAAATFDPNMQPSAPGQAPQPQMAGQPAPVNPSAPFDPQELKMITGALTGRLKLLGGIQEHLSGKPPKGV